MVLRGVLGYGSEQGVGAGGWRLCRERVLHKARGLPVCVFPYAVRRLPALSSLAHGEVGGLTWVWYRGQDVSGGWITLQGIREKREKREKAVDVAGVLKQPCGSPISQWKEPDIRRPSPSSRIPLTSMSSFSFGSYTMSEVLGKCFALQLRVLNAEGNSLRKDGCCLDLVCKG